MLNYEYQTVPYKHQEKTLARCAHRKEFALFLEMGLGKSKVLLDNAAILYEAGKINALLIITPKGNLRNWDKNEIPKHLPDRINRKVVVWQPNHTKAWKQEYCSLVLEEHSDRLEILTMNVEAFSTEKGLKFARAFVLGHETMIAVDESTLIKNPQAKRTRNLLSLSREASYKRILTGFPVTKTPLDLYAQCAFLNPLLLGFKSYYAFKARYAITKMRRMGHNSFQEVVGYHRMDELQGMLKEFSARYTKDKCLDLPEKVYMQRNVELSEEQKKAYEQMRKEALMIIADEVYTTQTVLTQLMRLQQIVAGSLRAPSGEVQVLKNNRIGETLNILEEISGKAVVFAVFQTDIEQLTRKIAEVYGDDSVASYYGKTSQKDREAILDNFQDPDHPLRFFVSNPHTGGRGLTLTAASHMIFYSNSYDLELRIQAEDRIHRIGQDKSCTYIDLVCENTVDEKILASLKKKVDISNEVLGEVRQWFGK